MKYARYGFRIILYYFIARILEEILRSSRLDGGSKNSFLDREVNERAKCQLKAGLRSLWQLVRLSQRFNFEIG